MGGYPTDEAPDDILQQMQQRKSAQASNLQAVQQDMAQEIEGKQQEFEARKDDLMLGERLLKMLDPQVPKPARQFLYRELSTSLGVDPKGDTSKNVGQLLLSLDPESAEGLRRSLSQKITSAQPGEVNKTVKSILTGEVGGMEVLGLVQQASVKSEEEPSAPGTAVAGSEQRVAQAAPVDAGARRRLPTVGETPLRHGDAAPQLVDALGLEYDADKPPRTSDVLRKGYRVPLDPKEQQKLAGEIQEGRAATAGTILNASRLNAIVSGRPEVLGVVGAATRWIDEAVETARGVYRQLSPGIQHDTDPEAVRPLAKRAMDGLDQASGRTGIKRTAEDAARAENGLIAMAYSMASARGIPGNRLTNAIIAQHLKEIGSSASPEQLQAKLADTVRRSIEQNDRILETKIGKKLPLDFRTVTDDDLLLIKDNDKVIPKDFMKEMDAEAIRRAKAPGTKGGEPLERSSPTIEEEERLQQDDARRRDRREQTKEQREQQELELKALRESRAGRGEDRAEARADRQEKQSDRQYALAVRKEERLERQKRQDTIREAFLQLGKAVASSRTAISGGSSGGGGGDQDAGAFRITPAQRRAPPQPVDASRFQKRGR